LLLENQSLGVTLPKHLLVAHQHGTAPSHFAIARRLSMIGRFATVRSPSRVPIRHLDADKHAQDDDDELDADQPIAGA
jgi:hypothetical protein